MNRKTRIDKELYLTRPLGGQGLAVEDWWKDTYNDLNYYNANGNYSNAVGGTLTKCAKIALASAPFTLGAGAAVAAITQNCRVCCNADPRNWTNKSKREQCVSDCHQAKSKWQEEKAKQTSPYKPVTPSGNGTTPSGNGTTPTTNGKKGLSTGAWVAIGVGVVAIAGVAYFMFRKRK